MRYNRLTQLVLLKEHTTKRTYFDFAVRETEKEM